MRLLLEAVGPYQNRWRNPGTALKWRIYCHDHHDALQVQARQALAQGAAHTALAGRPADKQHCPGGAPQHGGLCGSHRDR